MLKYYQENCKYIRKLNVYHINDQLLCLVRISRKSNTVSLGEKFANNQIYFYDIVIKKFMYYVEITIEIKHIFSGRKRSPKQLKSKTKSSDSVDTTSWRALFYPFYSNWKWEKRKKLVSLVGNSGQKPQISISHFSLIDWRKPFLTKDLRTKRWSFSHNDTPSNWLIKWFLPSSPS